MEVYLYSPFAFVAFTGTTLHSYYLFVQDEDSAQYVIKIKGNLEEMVYW
jgi:hypothetical protein